MNIREISDVFKDTTSEISALKSYNFGWASDRVRQGNTEDFQELNAFPRVFFSVPTITGSDQTRKQDTYQVTLFFDDLLGYDNDGDADLTLQIDKWAALQNYATAFIQRLNLIKQTILPNYLFIPEPPQFTFDSFTGLQRMITVQLSFNLVVPTNCDPSIITLVQCIANIVTSSNLTASLTTVLKFAASLEGRATVTADINFVQKAEASLLTSAIVTGNITIPKTFNASLLATGTTTADLTVQAAASLLLDLYPNASAAYSLRKLRTAYSGSAVRVRASTSGAEGDVSFDVNSTISASSTLTVTAVGTSGLSIGQQVTFSTFWNAGGSNQNVFVTTWYDQSGNANNATQTTQASQPQIVSSGVIVLINTKPGLSFNGSSYRFNLPTISFSLNSISVIGVIKSNNLASNGFAFANPDSNRIYLGFILSSISYFGYGNSATSFNLGASTTNQELHELYSGINSNAYKNANSSTQITSSTANENGADISIGSYGRVGTLANFYNGNIQEIIFYTTNQSSNRTGIETNINTHYAIY